MEDMRAVGKDAGLKSFEQVRSPQASARPLLTPLQSRTRLTHLPSSSFQVKDLHLHPEMFSVANGLLTPTLKSRRVDIRKFFQEQIASMYSKTPI